MKLIAFYFQYRQFDFVFCFFFTNPCQSCHLTAIFVVNLQTLNIFYTVCIFYEIEYTMPNVTAKYDMVGLKVVKTCTYKLKWWLLENA